MSTRMARTYIHVIASRWITTRQHISFPRRCQTFRLLPALRTVRQLTKLHSVPRAARPTVGAARALGFAVSAPALKGNGDKPTSSASGTSPPLPRQRRPSLRKNCAQRSRTRRRSSRTTCKSAPCPRTSRVSSRRAGGGGFCALRYSLYLG
jgi:hypothetical protein